MENKMCCESIHNDYGVSFHACQRKAVVERGGRGYCKIHDPVYKKDKYEAKLKQWEIEREQRNARWKLENSAPYLLSALKAMYAHFGTLEDNHLMNRDCVNACKLAREAIAMSENKGAK